MRATMYVRGDRPASFYRAMIPSFVRQNPCGWSILATGTRASATACEVASTVGEGVESLRFESVEPLSMRWGVGSRGPWRTGTSASLRRYPGVYVYSEARVHLADQAAALQALLRLHAEVRLSACGSALGVAFRLLTSLGLEITQCALETEATGAFPKTSPQTYLNVLVRPWQGLSLPAPEGHS